MFNTHCREYINIKPCISHKNTGLHCLHDMHISSKPQDIYTRSTLCCVLLWFVPVSFTHIRQAAFPDTKEILRLFLCLCSNLEKSGRLIHMDHIGTCNISTAKQDIAKLYAYFMGYVVNDYIVLFLKLEPKLGRLCQKEVSKQGTSKYTPQILWDMFTYPCHWYLGPVSISDKTS